MLDPRTFNDNPAIAIAPNTLSNWQLLGKVGVGLLIGILISFMFLLMKITPSGTSLTRS